MSNKIFYIRNSCLWCQILIHIKAVYTKTDKELILYDSNLKNHLKPDLTKHGINWRYILVEHVFIGSLKGIDLQKIFVLIVTKKLDFNGSWKREIKYEKECRMFLIYSIKQS